MTGSLKNIKARQVGKIDGGLVAAKALLNKEGLLKLGPRPQVARSKKFEDTWKILLSDPPICHSDPNNWREPADVRPSSFPFCPRRYVMERLGLVMPSTFDVESNFYTEIGKAVHYVAQNALARTGRLWGFWSCARPSCKKRMDGPPTFLPEKKRCVHCDSNLWEYEELRVEVPEVGLRGHTDGVLVFKKHSDLLEVKTAAEEKVLKMRAMSDEMLTLMFQTETPWYGYWHQATTYASLISQLYPELPPVTGVQYMIFSRNSPKIMAAFTIPVAAEAPWWKEIRARIVMAQLARKQEVLPMGFAETQMDISSLPTCKWCTHKDVCLKPSGKVRYAADALYDTKQREALNQVLEKERTWEASSEET
jgi:hypothetical protein